MIQEIYYNGPTKVVYLALALFFGVRMLFLCHGSGFFF